MSRCLLGACTATLALCCACGSISRGGAQPDSAIYSELSHISAIDNHAHPSKVLARGSEDTDADALPPDAITDLALPTPMLEGSPYVPRAWSAMFDFQRSGIDRQVQSGELLRKREELQKSKGDSYPS